MTSPLTRRESHYGKVRDFFKKHSVGASFDTTSQAGRDMDSHSLSASINGIRDRSPPMSPTSLHQMRSPRIAMLSG